MTIRQQIIGVIFGLLVMTLLAACGEGDPAPAGDPPVLGGFESLPKQLATIALTPTPSPVMAAATGQAASVAPPSAATQGPPRPTPTLTPYVGLFLGQPTVEGEAPAPTLAPYVINPGIGGVPVVPGGSDGVPVSAGGSCSVPVASTLSRAYASVQSRLGCPVNSGAVVYGMATQPFERGHMFWRSDMRQIYALAANGQFWQTADSWNDSMPADDPAFAAPAGVLQPVRGFGLIWRTNAAIRDALGWATLSEAQYDGFWQDFEHGTMFIGNNSLIYALFTAEGQHSGPLSP
jgi:hypothetical protein